MEHSPKYEKIKDWYDKGLWSFTAVKTAVANHWITKAEFEEITGEKYEE